MPSIYSPTMIKRLTLFSQPSPCLQHSPTKTHPPLIPYRLFSFLLLIYDSFKLFPSFIFSTPLTLRNTFKIILYPQYEFNPLKITPNNTHKYLKCHGKHDIFTSSAVVGKNVALTIPHHKYGHIINRKTKNVTTNNPILIPTIFSDRLVAFINTKWTVLISINRNGNTISGMLYSQK